ncbi:MAG: proteasome assembly chaperone family protein, partial [Thermoplasmata archaeon]|nr:proteasome assembly chaperone family protein [Thermoplasmata archaeon]
MEDITIEFLEKPKLTNPIFIEGLPGVGNVGKLAAEHLLGELEAKKFADIYSKHFPPQVVVDDGGIIRLVGNQLHYVKRKGGQDLVILVGDFQGLTPEGQYELSDFIMNTILDMNVKRIYTLGGYGVGRMIATPRVIGAATGDTLVKDMKKLGVVFPKGEPGAGIVGASGLLLGLGKLRGLECICLMGETSGYFVDPKSAQAVLEVLQKALDVELDFGSLEERAKHIDQIASKLKDVEEEAERKED